jgi:sortase B
MNDGSMFTALRKFVDSSFLEDYSEIHVYRDGEMRIYRVFSCRKTDVFDECYTFYFDDDAQFETWLRGQAALSAVGTGIVPGPEDRILTLSTCATSGDEYARYVVQAVLEQVLERHPGGKS